MDVAALTALVVDALHLALTLCTPAVVACLLVGLLVGFFQAATQASDASVAFVPKLFVVAAVLLASRAAMTTPLLDLSSRILRQIVEVAR